MLKKAIFIIPVLIAGFFLFSKSLLADNDLKVVINEVAWMGTVESANNEWLELYNNTNSDIDLANWTLLAQDGTPIINLTGIIEASGYYLLERTSDDTLPEVTANQVYVGALGNTGEFLELRDADNNLIDYVDCSNGWFFGNNDTKTTMERINPLTNSQINNWFNSNLANGTPSDKNSVYVLPNIKPVAVAGDNQSGILGQEIVFDGSNSLDDGNIVNYHWDFGDDQFLSGIAVSHIYDSVGLFTVKLDIVDNRGATSSDSLLVNIVDVATTTAIISSGDVVINEFVAEPITGEKEWIELYNNTTSTISLSDFTITDGVGVIASLNDEILAHQFKIIELVSNKLNNSGDKISLNYHGNVIDQVVYGNWDDGNLSNNAAVATNPNSVARKNDGQDSGVNKNDFIVTTTVTKGASNIITVINEPIALPPINSSTGGSTPVPVLFFNKSELVINEFVSDPADDDVEWVELYNNSEEFVDLNDWLIIDGSGKKTELTGFIYSHQFKIIENPKGGLNNLGDTIILMSPNSNIIDQVSYGNFNDSNVFDNTLKSNNPDSVARLVDGVDTDIDYNDFRITNSPTKGLPNKINILNDLIAEKTEDPQINLLDNYPQIVISELLPNPIGPDMNDEFIELYNPNDELVNLNNWLLDDEDGGSRPYKIVDLIIEPHEYLALFRSDTKLALNNNEDRVRLINPLGDIVSEIDYKNIKEGLAYASVNNQWQLTTNPTPGEENEIELAIKKSSTVNSNKIIKITGTVLVEPGVLGSQIFYIRDENIQVYNYKKDFPNLAVGDIVEVVGELSESAGEKRIKTTTKNDIKVIGRQSELLPLAISAADIDESNLGQLVKIAGVILEVKGNYVYIDDGSDEAKIYLKSSAQIDKSLFIEGQNIELVGIVSNSNSGYRLLPRYNTDILRLSEIKGEQAENINNQLNTSDQKYFIAIIIFLGLIISWLAYWQYILKIKKSAK